MTTPGEQFPEPEERMVWSLGEGLEYYPLEVGPLLRYAEPGVHGEPVIIGSRGSIPRLSGDDPLRAPDITVTWRTHIETRPDEEGPYERTRFVHGRLKELPPGLGFEPLDPEYPGGAAEMLRTARRNVACALGLDPGNRAAEPPVHPEGVASATFDATRGEIAQALGMAPDDPGIVGLYPRVIKSYRFDAAKNELGEGPLPPTPRTARIEVTLLDGSTGYYEIEETLGEEQWQQ